MSGPEGVEWHLLTGEFPPQPGGVSDHTWQVAEGLAREGCPVHVWAPAGVQGSAPLGVSVHRLPGGLGVSGLRRLERALAQRPRPRRLLVQYVPHAFGYKAMNVPFAAWLARRPAHEQLWVLFHEVAFPWGRERPWRHNVLGATHRGMAALVASRADRLFVSTPWWRRLLPERLRHAPVEWLPVPSNLPTSVAPEAVAGTRARLASADTVLLGHLGTYGDLIAKLLEESLPELLRQEERRRAVLLGRGGARFAEALVARHPGLQGRLYAPGGLPAEELAAHLRACDVVLQPFPDGLSTRRSSAMAALGLGLPVVSNAGPATEALWHSSSALVLAPHPTGAAVREATESLLSSPERWEPLGRHAADFYAAHLSLEHTLEVLLGRKPSLSMEEP